MTRPDVAALAAAQRQHDKDYAADFRAGDQSWTWERHAEAIIAALAAQGWRITADKTWTYPSNPDHPLSASERLDLIEADYNAKVAASNARIAELSAQAAPDPGMDVPPRSILAAYEADVRDIEQAAVRAALEGLRAEVAGVEVAEHALYVRYKMLAIIDARLAALDA